MRADKFFAEKFGSRTKSAEAIEKGLVLVNGKTIKPKIEIKETDVITFVEAQELFVSNGGYKLDRAIKTFDFSPKGLTFADIGASTGGFTDCLLQNGAKKVYAIDVGESLLHEKIANDARIVTMDNTNARYLTKADFPEEIQGVVTDVSFISLRLIFPVIQEILMKNGSAFVLIKPQFECGKEYLGNSGIVKSKQARITACLDIYNFSLNLGLVPINITNAPIKEKKNIEYVIMLKKGKIEPFSQNKIYDLV